jgi:hypothetical protein
MKIRIKISGMNDAVRLGVFEGVRVFSVSPNIAKRKIIKINGINESNRAIK